MNARSRPAVARWSAAGIALASLCGAVQAQWAPAPVPSLCTLEHVQGSSDPAELRLVESKCFGTHPVYMAALDKLESLPMPPDTPRWMSMPADGHGPFNRVTLEADVFFNYAEAYPLPVAFDRLADLVRRLRAAHDIELITLSSSQDSYEARDRPVDIAAARSETVRRYLVAAGIDPHRIVAGAQPADHEDTAEGRARDRCTRIKVLMKVAANKP